MDAPCQANAEFDYMLSMYLLGWAPKLRPITRSAPPRTEGVNPEDYPDIHKMAILADVAPYSREYNTFRQIVGKQASA